MGAVLSSCAVVIITNPKKMPQKKKIQYKSHSQYKRPKAKKYDWGKSMTIQNESISVREFLERHTQGIYDPTVIKEGIYDDNPSHNDEVTHSAKTKLELAEQALESSETIRRAERETREFQELQKRLNDESKTTMPDAVSGTPESTTDGTEGVRKSSD